MIKFEHIGLILNLNPEFQFLSFREHLLVSKKTV